MALCSKGALEGTPPPERFFYLLFCRFCWIRVVALRLIWGVAA